MRQLCPATKQPCHVCKRNECGRELDYEAEALFGSATPITRDITKLARELHGTTLAQSGMKEGAGE